MKILYQQDNKTAKGRLDSYLNYLLLAFAGFLAISLVQNIVSLQASNEAINKKNKEVLAIEEKNKKLKDDLKKVQSEEFIEKQIRDQLGLVKEGEVVLVLPDVEILRGLVPDIQEESEELPDPVWKKWIQLFIN